MHLGILEAVLEISKDGRKSGWPNVSLITTLLHINSSFIENMDVSWMQWSMPIIPALREAEADLWIQGQSCLQSEFHNSQGYAKKPCPKKAWMRKLLWVQYGKCPWCQCREFLKQTGNSAYTGKSHCSMFTKWSNVAPLNIRNTMDACRKTQDSHWEKTWKVIKCCTI